jgi:threonine dehydrogenase-like Zn-dependent dehydrogenase
MNAVVLRRGESSPTLADVPHPDPDPGEALVRTLRVGVDGTDHEVLAGSHGALPEGSDHLILGHEAVGVVVDPNGTDWATGDVVVSTVRRPPPSGKNEYFERGQPDMAPTDATVECGIDGAHGFMAEYFAAPGEYLVPLPRDLASVGFLVEPLSVAEKALDHARAARSAFDWTPESALVLGNGSLGLLTLAILDGFERRYCLGRRSRPDPTIDLVDVLDATYVDGRKTPVPEIPAAHEPMDLVYEATGHAPHALDAVRALAPNGVAALLGVPGDRVAEVDVGSWHREVVLGNRAVVGSVNAGERHFRAAVDSLGDLPDSFLDDFVTRVAPVAEFEAAFDASDEVVKTAVEFDSLDADD